MTRESSNSTSRPRKRVRNKDEKIALIYKSFFDLVGKMGYSNVSTNHVASDAGISIGTIYRYFPKGKISIIQDYFDSTQEEVFDIDKLNPRELVDLQGFFKKYLVEFVRVHREQKVHHQAYEHAMLENPEVLECYTQKVTSFIEAIATKLHELHPAFKNVSTERLLPKLLLVFNIFEALTRQHLFMPLFPTDAEYIEFLMHLLEYLTGSSS